MVCWGFWLKTCGFLVLFSDGAKSVGFLQVGGGEGGKGGGTDRRL